MKWKYCSKVQVAQNDISTVHEYLRNVLSYLAPLLVVRDDA